MATGVDLGLARYQRDVVRGMGELALAGLVPGPLRPVLSGGAPVVPGEWIERRVPALPGTLLDAYAGAVGAPRDGTVPPHLFPQWAFAMSGELMRGLRYPLLRAVNGGCRLEVRGALPRGRELIVRGRLAAVDDDGARAVITQRFTTGVEGATQLLAAEVRVFVPLARRRPRGEKKAPPRAAEPPPSEIRLFAQAITEPEGEFPVAASLELEIDGEAPVVARRVGS